MRKGFEEDTVLEEKLLDWLITQGYSHEGHAYI